jgi:hypothetical protein
MSIKMKTENNPKTLSILGCGWTGKVLQVHLQERYQVHCLSRDMAANRAAGYYDCDVLVIAVPPRGEYLAVLEETLLLLPEGAQVILLSSISYYDGKELVVAGEELVRGLWSDAVVLRLGGLMGDDRIAGRYTAGKTLPYDSMSNYVHRADVVGVISVLIVQGVRAEVLDLVAPVQHPKSEIFAANATRFGFERTGFDSLELRGKRISAGAWVERLGYAFVYPDVYDFWD